MNNNNIPLLTIVCTTFQHAAFIRDALDSFVAQKCNFTFEVIVHDDASTDGTAEIILEYARRYPDLIFPIIQPVNVYSQGQRPWLICFKKARGKYIALCEGDDYWTDPLKIQKQVDIMEADKNISLCFHNALKKHEDKYDGAKDFYYVGPSQKADLGTEDLFCQHFIPTASILFRRPEGEWIPSWFHTAQSGDITLALLLSLHGRFRYLNEVMAIYRYHGAGMSDRHNGLYKVRGMIHLYECFNAHTAYRFNDRINEAIQYEIGHHLPEMRELKRLRALNLQAVHDDRWYRLYLSIRGTIGKLKRTVLAK